MLPTILTGQWSEQCSSARTGLNGKKLLWKYTHGCLLSVALLVAVVLVVVGRHVALRRPVSGVGHISAKQTAVMVMAGSSQKRFLEGRETVLARPVVAVESDS